MARSNCYGPVSATLEMTPRGHVPGNGPMPAAPLSSSWWIDGRVCAGMGQQPWQGNHHPPLLEAGHLLVFLPASVIQPEPPSQIV
ncbi:hypothetical protein U9M48_025011 [Paspalum notatum var. saurae]|uniref:Uncharacterized protein n=1 Tax=Paspalum notatum var. saurae TaxID=547442 RepID=A0AAQ3WX45_PASNO